MTTSTTALATYTINIRSFHPKKHFPYTGFEGDNRGFNTEGNSPSNTSRIWHKLFANLAKPDFYTVERSHASKHPLLNQPVKYNDPKLRPKGQVISASRREMGDGRVGFAIEGTYSGSNHAMPASQEMKDAIGTTYVPEIDVNYKIRLDVDRRQGFMDLVLYVTGDGFPNCEAFLVGPNDQRIFLGVHVRRGIAPSRLSLNLNMPMIASAVRLPLTKSGALKGSVGDELQRKTQGNRNIHYQSIDKWNDFFRNRNPNAHCPTLPTKGEMERCFP